ncbi:MAG: glycosyltransferase family 4 protein [Verrucomicrobia bacterium]|nr:glycosyltransferase family 4 protein [Verrucomicrobiota bacterium]
MEVAFINENTLGHASYLLPFVEMFGQRPELGIRPHLINATPLPPSLEWRANGTVPGLRRWGLDFHNARWRLTASRCARDQLRQLRRRQHLDAVVVNTQSVALALLDLRPELPLVVSLDATFEQLARSAWFAPNPISRRLLPLTLAPLRRRERLLFQNASRLLPWSGSVRQSLLDDYALTPDRITLLPPSVTLPPPRSSRRPAAGRPQILFVGGDFQRKGGPLLVECFRERLADRCELHLVTHSAVPAQPGLNVHRTLTPRSPGWQERWEQAAVFAFPSTLETFGIVLLEALAFEVPVVSADVGAAREVLADGRAGWLLPERTPADLARAISEALDQPAVAAAKVNYGRQQIQRAYDLGANAEKLAAELTHCVARPPRRSAPPAPTARP